MTPEERTALATQIERHVRRGELSEAWAELKRLREAFPEDDALALRFAQFEQCLDPIERRPVGAAGNEPSGSHISPMHQAEAHAAAGRYAEAISIYRALIGQHPEWELVKERLQELFQLAQVVARPQRQPVDRETLLKRLLERISTRKRP